MALYKIYECATFSQWLYIWMFSYASYFACQISYFINDCNLQGDITIIFLTGAEPVIGFSKYVDSQWQRLFLILSETERPFFAFIHGLLYEIK